MPFNSFPLSFTGFLYSLSVRTLRRRTRACCPPSCGRKHEGLCHIGTENAALDETSARINVEFPMPHVDKDSILEGSIMDAFYSLIISPHVAASALRVHSSVQSPFTASEIIVS